MKGITSINRRKNKQNKMDKRSISCFVIMRAVCVAFMLCIISCASSKIDDNLTASQIIQQGQNAEDMGFYRTAEKYYTCALERFGTDGLIYVESRYSLGHLHIKTHKWQDAYVELRELVQMYESSLIGQSPVSPTFYKLAKIELDKIPEKQLPSIEAHLIKEAEMLNDKARKEEEQRESTAATEERDDTEQEESEAATETEDTQMGSAESAIDEGANNTGTAGGNESAQ